VPPLRFRLRAGAFALALAVLAVAAAGCTAGGAPASTGSRAAGVPSSAPSPRSATTVVTIGDSIMAGYGLDPDDAWPELLAEQTRQPVVNLACSGAGFVAEGECGVAFSGLIPEAAAAQPAVVILQSSDNDVDEDRADIEQATRATVERLHDALPDTRIVGIGTLWNLEWEAPESVGWSSEALRRAVDAAGGTFVSIGQPFQQSPDLLQWDGEHPTAAGQRMLAARIRTALDDVGVEL
jgi:acyl-CoA thioesterase I